ILLIDVDPGSSERGALVPTVAATPPTDGWIGEGMLAIAPRPGFVLHPKRRYAFVVFTNLPDAMGRSLGVPPALADLVAGKAPAGAKGADALALYQPL